MFRATMALLLSLPGVAAIGTNPAPTVAAPARAPGMGRPTGTGRTGLLYGDRRDRTCVARIVKEFERRPPRPSAGRRDVPDGFGVRVLTGLVLVCGAPALVRFGYSPQSAAWRLTLETPFSGE